MSPSSGPTEQRYGKPSTLLLLTAGVVSTLSGCATQINSPSQPVLFLSDPPGAQVWVDDRFAVVTPGIVRLSRLSEHNARVEKAGYRPAVIEIDRGMSWWTLLDIVCLPLVVNCILKDRRDGGYYTMDKEVTVTLAPDGSALQDSSTASQAEDRPSEVFLERPAGRHPAPEPPPVRDLPPEEPPAPVLDAVTDSEAIPTPP